MRADPSGFGMEHPKGLRVFGPTMITRPPTFDPGQLAHLATEMAQVKGGADLSIGDVHRLTATWKPVVQPVSKHEEPFDLVTERGDTTGVIAPRWLCHLMGLCHRTVHLVLRTPQDWLVLQMRSRRVDWPGMLDLAVTGHVRAGLSWEEAIRAEAAEELGLDLAENAGMLVSSSLVTRRRSLHPLRGRQYQPARARLPRHPGFCGDLNSGRPGRPALRRRRSRRPLPVQSRRSHPPDDRRSPPRRAWPGAITAAVCGGSVRCHVSSVRYQISHT